MPYDELVCDFLNSLSGILLASDAPKPYPDVALFAYWCRKANIARLKREFEETRPRLGLGMVFHIAPSNVPINFAFSYVFSLLAGNANIIRVSSKDFSQTHIVCDVINHLFLNEKYKKISDMTAFVSYAQDDEITSHFSSMCNARIVWGGDQTIHHIRKITIPERSIDIAFSDRYSLCVIDGKSILHLNSETLNRLASSFYNDTYLMDQNACSSPHLVVWLGEGDELVKAKKKFWDSVYRAAESKYELHPVNAVDKYTLICKNAIDYPNITNFKKYGNFLYCLELDGLPDDMHALRGRFGCFFEHHTEDINSIAHIINTKYQTLTYFGLDKSYLVDFVISNRLSGIDRIVPIGSALDISVIWDGYDIVRTLSRVIYAA
jgi:hypothetical protein